MGRVARGRSKARGAVWRDVIDVSEERLAGYCSILLAATMLLAVVTYVLLPQRPTEVNAILSVAGTSPGWFRVLYGALAAGGLFGLAVVGPASGYAGEVAPQWVAWARRLAYLAFAVTLVQGVRMALVLPQLGALYHGCFQCPVSLATQQDVARGVYLALPLDPAYWIIFGGLGLWTLAVSLASLRSASVPPPLAYVGIALAVGYWLIVVTLTAGQVTAFGLVSVVVAAFLGPLWYIWLGVLLTARK